MDRNCICITVGDHCEYPPPTTITTKDAMLTTFTKNSISFPLMNPKSHGYVSVVILKKDLLKIETNFYTTAPFICLYTTQAACTRINKRLADLFPSMVFNTKSKDEGVKRIFIFLTYNTEVFVQFLTANFNKTTHLTAQEASNLLKVSKLLTRQTIQDVEQKLVEIINPSEKLIYMPAKNLVQSNRSTSSFVVFFRDRKMTKKSFEIQLNSLKSWKEMLTLSP